MQLKAVWLVPAVAGAVLITTLAGCGSQQSGSSATSNTPSPSGGEGLVGGRTFVGKVDNSDALIGMTTYSEWIRVYLCNGTPDKPNTIGAWWDGEMSGDKADLVSKADAHLSATLESNRVVGSVKMPDGKELSFTAPEATGQAAVYIHETNLEGTDYTFVWIVQPDGQQRGTAYPPFIRCPGRGPEAGVGGSPEPEGICDQSPVNTETKTAEVEGLGTVQVEPLLACSCGTSCGECCLCQKGD